MAGDEFEIIRMLFAPLATHAGARGLADDAALFAGHVVTTDAIVEGVHFLPDDPIETVAQKALRVNLSDLAAKGAKPVGALLTLIWPQTRSADEIAAFARGLGEDLRLFDVALLGGDTSTTPGPLTISIAAFGAPLGPRTPSRADARIGDEVWLSGPVGDSYLGLRALTAPEVVPQREAVIARYRVPQPRLDLAALVAQCAHASMDVSDGLFADLTKLAAASAVAIRIDHDAIPISVAGGEWLARGGARDALIGHGDDYEIVLTAAPQRRTELAARGLVRIGEVVEGAGLWRPTGEPIAAAGYSHRLGR